jgi:hypothetical protein
MGGVVERWGAMRNGWLWYKMGFYVDRCWAKLGGGWLNYEMDFYVERYVAELRIRCQS